jgi:hypothetical protein
MRRILGALTMLLIILGLVATTAAGCPGQNPKPVPTYTPAPAWSWPYGQSPAPTKGKAVPPGHPSGVLADFTWPKPTTTPVRKRVIEVVDQVKPSKWNVRQAMDWLDRYTTSDMRLVSRCSGHAWRCVIVRGGKLPGSYLGVTEGNRITIDTAKVDRHGYRSNLSREKILAHELFHTYGYGHSGSGHNLMRPRMSQIRLYLTTGQRRYLAAR